METKICKKCKIEKLHNEFNKDKYSKDGLRYRCRECTSEEYRTYYYNNVENEIIRQVNYQKNNSDQVKEKRNTRHNKKYNNDPLYKMKTLIRNRLKIFLKSKKIFEIIGYHGLVFSMLRSRSRNASS